MKNRFLSLVLLFAASHSWAVYVPCDPVTLKKSSKELVDIKVSEVWPDMRDKSASPHDFTIHIVKEADGYKFRGAEFIVEFNESKKYGRIEVPINVVEKDNYFTVKINLSGRELGKHALRVAWSKDTVHDYLCPVKYAYILKA